MADIIAGNYDFSPFPWSQWLDGRVWRAIAGDDFTVRPQTFKGYIRSAARERGVTVDVRIEDTGNVVWRANTIAARTGS